ncbi:MAG TPA: hypothetical protein VJ697_10910 [Nitrososphaeraceae archaeon]|nr:hypothetical protein [Nitrososphaeraceae archaeon]
MLYLYQNKLLIGKIEENEEEEEGGGGGGEGKYIYFKKNILIYL